MKCCLKYKDWSSKEFILFDSLKLDQEQANVSFLMKEFKGTKFVRERSTGKTFLMQKDIASKKNKDFQSNAFYSNQDDDCKYFAKQDYSSFAFCFYQLLLFVCNSNSSTFGDCL